MRAALDKVRKALSRQGIVGHMTHYLVKEGRIYASDGRMMASAPFPCDVAAMIPGAELEMLLDRLGDDAVMVHEGDAVKLKSGRLRGTIQVLPPDEYVYAVPTDTWSAPPDNFLQALKSIRPFISDNAVHHWALCAALYEDSMVATTNVSLAEVGCPGLGSNGVLLPCWAIDFLLSRAQQLTGMQHMEGALAWCWEDGSWMKTQLVQGEFPKMAIDLLDNAEEPTWELSAEWRAAYKLISEMAADIVEIYTDRLVGKKGQAISEHDAESPAPEGGMSRWNPKFLDIVTQVATHWQPDYWPKAAPFIGENIRGVIMGRA